jgi:hypothetical protein
MAANGLRDFRKAGDGFPDFQVVLPQILFFIGRQLGIAPQVQDFVAVEAGEVAAVAVELFETDCKLNLAKAVLEEELAGLLMEQSAVEDHGVKVTLAGAETASSELGAGGN